MYEGSDGHGAAAAAEVFVFSASSGSGAVTHAQSLHERACAPARVKA